MSEELLINDLRNGETLLNLLGSFWNRLYGDSDFVGHITDTRAMSERQTFRNLMEYVACTSRFDVPIYHRDNWKLLTFKASEVVQTNNTFSTSYSVPLSSLENFITARNVMNRIVQPTVLWTEGLDFHIEDDTLVLLTNPATDDRFNKRPIFDLGIVVDQEVDIWLFNSDFDFGYAYEQFGYVLSVYLSSTENYRNLLNSIFDAVVLGTSRLQIELLLAAMFDVPLVIEAEETIENIFDSRSHLTIVTDKNIYKNSLTAAPLVAIGDKVRAGQFLTNAIEVVEFGLNRPSNSAMTAVSFGTGFLFPTGSYVGSIKWRDATVPTTVTLNVSGKTKIEWELGGQTVDVDAFWAAVHANGVTTGTTVANLMDTRSNKVGEPGVSNLPSTINPFIWLSDNILKYNTFGMVIRTDNIGENSLSITDPLSFLRKIVPPNIGTIYQTLTSPVKEFDVRALLKKQMDLTYTVSAVIGQVTKSFGVDAILKGTTTKTYGVDAIIGRITKSYTVNAVLKTTTSKTYGVDAIVV